MSLIRVAPPRAEWAVGVSETLGAAVGDVLGVRIEHAGEIVYEDDVPDVAAFAKVPEREPLLYINSLGDLALALNRDDLAATYAVAVADSCLARAAVVCETCGRACPERAIRFLFRRGGPPLPVVDDDRCTGCGACVGPTGERPTMLSAHQAAAKTYTCGRDRSAGAA